MRIPISNRLLAAVFTTVLCFAAVSGQASTDPRMGIELNGHLVTVLGPAHDVAGELKVYSGDPGSDILLVKFPGPVTADQLRRLETQVDRIFTYLPHDAFLVRASLAKSADLESNVGAAWTANYHPAYKIGPGAEIFSHAKSRALKPLMIHVFPDIELDPLVEELERLGARVTGLEARERFSRLRLLVSPQQLTTLKNELAQRPEIFFFDLETRRVLLNDTTAWVSQTGVSGGQQKPIHNAGIYGDGQIVGVLDTGIDPDMCFFRDTVNGLPPTNACNSGTTVNLSQRKVIAVDFLHSGECSGGISSSEWDTQDHGTHVAGTIAGDNFANPGVRDSADGMAPAAKLVIQDGGYATDNCADLPALGCPVVDLNPIFQQAYNQGARIHSNSWGDDENNPVKGLYTAGSEDSDEFMWNHKDFLLVYAAGNDGPGNGRIGSPATAKNVVAVGATLRGSSAQSMASFSSCGPTQDGRIKPDVTLPGSSIISANSDNNTGSNNCNTKSSSGTSMAAPGVAGAAALVREYFVDGFYPSGSANGSDSLTPSAALLKATLISSGQNMTGVSGWPANCEGWGRVALDDALELSGDSRSLIVDDNAGFAQGSSNDTVTYDIQVDSSSEALKVSLVWTDYPSTPAAGTHLVNDLDLEVSGPSGSFKGNVFSGGVSTTGGSADRLNSVEQVLVASPTAGSYTVTVRSFTVPQGPQPFALVITGDVSECAPPGCNAAPSVSITSPADGSSATAGDSVSFAGTASDPEDGNLTAGLSWSSSLDGAIGSGGSFSTSSLSVGNHTITASVTDSGSQSGSDSIALTINPIGGGGVCDGTTCIDWDVTGTVSYSNQDGASNVTVQDDGDTLFLQDNTWRRTTQTFNVTVDTVVEFDFTSTSQGEIHGIGFDADDTLSSDRMFKVHGTQNWGITDYDNYTSGTVSYSIPVGQFFTGSAMYLVLVNDNDAGSGNNSSFTNVRVFENGGGGGGGGGGGSCAADEDFSGGSGGWTTSGSCSTGTFVAGTPTQIVSSGVTTQLAGDHTTGSGNAWFTAPNSSAGSHDVDGGSCVTTSPTYSVTEASDVSIWFFHGQRDAGDDSTDGFLLEISTNGGSTWTTLQSYGDVTVNAVWTEATTTVAAGTSVVFRATATDGTSGGDLVEAGLDDLTICPQ